MADETYTSDSKTGANTKETNERIIQGKKTGAAADKLAVQKGMQESLGSRGAAGSGMPKMKPGQSPSAYGEEMRQWREGQKTPQKKAIDGMLAGESKED